MDSKKTAEFSSYSATIKRRRLVLVAVAMPILLGGILLAFGLPSKYTSTALFRFERATMSEYIGGTAGGYVDQYVTSLSDMVLNDESLLRMAKETQLTLGEGLPNVERAKQLRRATKVKMISEKILDPRDGRDRPLFSSFEVSFTSRNAQEAARAAEWLSQEYVTAARRSKQRPNEASAAVLAEEGERFRVRISDLEQKLARFKQQNFNQLPESANSNLNSIERAESELQTIEAQIASLRRERVVLAGQYEQANNPNASQLSQLEDEYRRLSTTYDPSHPDVIALRRQIENLRAGGGAATLKEQLASQKSMLAEAKLRYSDDHPDVKKIQRDISALEARIKAGETSAPRPATAAALQVQSQVNAVESQLSALSSRAAELRGKLRDTEINIKATPEVEREYQTLTRDLAVAKEKYDALSKEQMDKEVATAAVAAGSKDEFRLIKRPTTPRDPSAPVRPAITVLAALLALMFGFIAVTLAEIMDPTVRGNRDVESILGVSALAAVPVIDTPESIGLRQRRLSYLLVPSSAVAVLVFFLVRTFIW